MIEITRGSMAFEVLLGMMTNPEAHLIRIEQRTGGVALKRNEGVWTPTLTCALTSAAQLGTIALSQLRQVTEGSGGNVVLDEAVGSYMLKFPSGLSMYGAISELAQLGLGSEHVEIWADRTAWINLRGVTA